MSMGEEDEVRIFLCCHLELESHRIHSEVYMESQRSRVTYTTLKLMSKVGGLTLPDFKAYYKAVVIKIVCIGERIDRWISGTK